MSTKAIIELIQEMRRVGTEEQSELAVRALAETAAIERACKRIAAGYIRLRPSDAEDGTHIAVLERIGEDAP